MQTQIFKWRKQYWVRFTDGGRGSGAGLLAAVNKQIREFPSGLLAKDDGNEIL